MEKVLPGKVKVAVYSLRQGRFNRDKTALPALGHACVPLGRLDCLITTRQKAQHTAISDAIAVTTAATCKLHACPRTRHVPDKLDVY